MSSVEVLLNSRRPASQRREAAGFIKDEVRRLDGRVKDFLAFARPKPMASSRVNLNALLKKVLLSCAAHGREGFRIEQRLSCHAPLVVGDTDQLHQVILNLVLNADQAMPEGGTLAVATEVAEDQVHMRFEDEGGGIAAGDMPRIFDPFFTTKQEGTGLGLPIVHQILTAHRGKITIRNRDNGGRGVVVDIIMPLAVGAGR
jgi:signal transduction histidine kinase